jgi:hypothetical protein
MAAANFAHPLDAAPRCARGDRNSRSAARDAVRRHLSNSEARYRRLAEEADQGSEAV